MQRWVALFIKRPRGINSYQVAKNVGEWSLNKRKDSRMAIMKRALICCNEALGKAAYRRLEIKVDFFN